MQRAGMVGLAAALIAPAAMTAQVSRPVQSPSQIVQGQVDAFNKGDADAFAAFYAEDVQLFDLGAETKPNLAGRTALIARYKPMLAKYHPRATILSRIPNGDFVIDNERTTAGGRSSDGVAIYQIENGKIRRVWFTP